MAVSPELEALLSVIRELRSKRRLELRPDDRDKLLYSCVITSANVPQVAEAVQNLMGVPFKPAGTSAVWKNWFDPFVRGIGGIRRNQSLYRKDLPEGSIVYCAFWPWASDPTRVSIRLGLQCPDEAVRARLEKEQKP